MWSKGGVKPSRSFSDPVSRSSSGYEADRSTAASPDLLNIHPLQESDEMFLIPQYFQTYPRYPKSYAENLVRNSVKDGAYVISLFEDKVILTYRNFLSGPVKQKELSKNDLNDLYRRDVKNPSSSLTLIDNIVAHSQDPDFARIDSIFLLYDAGQDTLATSETRQILLESSLPFMRASSYSTHDRFFRYEVPDHSAKDAERFLRSFRQKGGYVLYRNPVGSIVLAYRNRDMQFEHRMLSHNDRKTLFESLNQNKPCEVPFLNTLYVFSASADPRYTESKSSTACVIS